MKDECISYSKDTRRQKLGMYDWESNPRGTPPTYLKSVCKTVFAELTSGESTFSLMFLQYLLCKVKIKSLQF